MAWALWFTVFFVLLGATSWMPSLYIKTAGVSPSTASLLSAVVTLAAICVIILVGNTVDRVGRRRWFLIGYAIALVGAVLATVLAATGNLHTWPALLIAGGSCWSASAASTPSSTPTRPRSTPPACVPGV